MEILGLFVFLVMLALVIVLAFAIFVSSMPFAQGLIMSYNTIKGAQKYLFLALLLIAFAIFIYVNIKLIFWSFKTLKF